MVRKCSTSRLQTRGREPDRLLVAPAMSGTGAVLCVRDGRALRTFSAEVTEASPIDLYRRDNIDVLRNSRQGKECRSRLAPRPTGEHQHEARGSPFRGLSEYEM